MNLDHLSIFIRHTSLINYIFKVIKLPNKKKKIKLNDSKCIKYVFLIVFTMTFEKFQFWLLQIV